MPLNQPTVPRSFPGPASIPAIPTVVDHHANDAATSSAGEHPETRSRAVALL
jgi:hypothetical protein